MENNIPIKYSEKEKKRRSPAKVNWLLKPITWIIAYPSLFRHRTKIEKINMANLKPPYLLLCNHNSFYDFKVATAATFPHQPYYVVSLEAFIGRDWLMRNVGCIGKRKFTNDINLIRSLKKVVDRGKIAGIYPEARYSLCGTNAVLPPSLGKLAKLLEVPVVILMTRGNHIIQPVYHQKKVRKVRTMAVMQQVVTQEEITKLSPEEINDIINKSFVYDDFSWQKESRIKVKYKKRAQGLHKVLYQCPHCEKEYRMTSKGTKLWCMACGKEWEMNEYGEMHAVLGEDYFTHIPTWYEWERINVRKEVIDGTYHFESEVAVKSLPNTKGFINVGSGILTHNMNGFELIGDNRGSEYRLKLPTQSLYSVHIEYDYLKEKRDCIMLSTISDTYFIFPKGEDFSVTKMSLATEELFEFYHRTHSVESKEKIKKNIQRSEDINAAE